MNPNKELIENGTSQNVANAETEQKSDCSFDKQEIVLNGKKDAAENSQLQVIPSSDQSVSVKEAIDTNGFDLQTDINTVDKHESLLIADCVVDAIIGAASASGDNIPDVISCTGEGKEDSVNKEVLNNKSEVKSETVEAKMADTKAEVVSEEDWVICDSNNEKNIPSITGDVVDSPKDIDNIGVDKNIESKDMGEDNTPLSVISSDVDKTEIVNEPVVIEKETTSSTDPMVASVESESSFEKIDHFNNMDVHITSDVCNTEEPKAKELRVDDSNNVEGMAQLDQSNMVNNAENLDQNKNKIVDDNKPESPILEKDQETKTDVLTDKETVSKEINECGENATIAGAPMEMNVDQPESVPVVTELPPKPPTVEENIVSPVATKRKSKLTKQNSETDKTKRDSYQETKQEIKESLSFIKSKLIEPIAPIISTVEQSIVTVIDEGKTEKQVETTKEECQTEKPVENVKEKNNPEKPLETVKVESKPEKPVDLVKAKTKTDKVESKAEASKQDSPKSSSTPDYEPISVNDPDPVYESVQESTPSPQEIAKSSGKSGTKQSDKVEIIEKTDLSTRQFGVECIPPLRPVRTKKSEKMEVPSWKPPEQNIMTYLCGCFMRRQN